MSTEQTDETRFSKDPRPGTPPGPPPGNRPPGVPPSEHPPGEHPPGGEPPGRIVKPKKPYGEGQLSELPPPCVPLAVSPVTQAGTLWPWWEICPKRWEWERGLVNMHYRQFTSKVRDLPAGRIVVWTGTIRPWPRTAEEATTVIRLLSRDEPVRIVGGRIEPPAKTRCDSPPKYVTTAMLEEEYHVEVFHLPPPAHPRAYILKPQVSVMDPHMYGDRSICPLTPQSNEWSWERDTLVDFLDGVSEWALKHSIWKKTKRWIGSATPHGGDSLLHVRPSDQCPCRSGKPYGECCGKRL